MRGSSPLLDEIAHPRISPYEETVRPRLMVLLIITPMLYVTYLLFTVVCYTKTS